MNDKRALFNALEQELKHFTSRLNVYYNPIDFGAEAIPGSGDTETEAMLKLITAFGDVLDKIIDGVNNEF